MMTTEANTTRPGELPRRVVAIDPLRCARCAETIPTGETLMLLGPDRFVHLDRCPKYRLRLIVGGHATQLHLPGMAS